MIETERHQQGEPLKQGDVFIWHDVPPTDQNAWMLAGIIVTADCDLVRGKHGGFVSYVPLLTPKEYLSIRFIPDMIAKRKRKLLVEFINRFRRAATNSESENFSDELLEKIATNETPLDGALPDALESKKKSASEARTAFKSFIELCAKDELAATARALFPQSENPNDELTKKCRDHLKGRLPGDAFFINHVAGLSNRNFIAYLRQVRHTPASAFSQPHRPKEMHAVRVARLRPTFRHRLTQQMAEVFTAIGLPEAYETSRKENADKVSLA